MAIDLTVPEWLQIKCSAWIDRLRMHEWDVAIGLALVVREDPDTRACAEQHPDINFGRITFRADAEDTQEWEATLVHELLHIKHSRIDSYIDRIVLPNMQGVEMGFGYLVYKSHLEPFTESLAQALVKIVGPV